MLETTVSDMADGSGITLPSVGSAVGEAESTEGSMEVVDDASTCSEEVVWVLDVLDSSGGRSRTEVV
jgi:hypothetical protein